MPLAISEPAQMIPIAVAACMIAVYVESSSMFVRGGVYKVVRHAMGPGLAKVAVSALMFDYVLTGPISSVSAGQYLDMSIEEGVKLIISGGIVKPDAGAGSR